MTSQAQRAAAPRGVFHSVVPHVRDPQCGKSLLAALAIGIALQLPRAAAALPAPPPLPFPLPAADLRITQTSTFYAPDTFLHLAELNRPLSDADLVQFDDLLTRRRWTAIASAAASRDLLDQLVRIAPTPELQHPFLATTALFQQGMRVWTLDPVQLVYTPGDPAVLTISFPPSPQDAPKTPGAYTAELPLPLPQPQFIQAIIQSNANQIVRLETWQSFLPPEQFLNQSEPMLIAAGWTAPIHSIPDTQHPQHRAQRNQLRYLEKQFQNLFRVYHRGTAQLSLLYMPEETTVSAAPAHRYTLMHRTLLAWPPADAPTASIALFGKD